MNRTGSSIAKSPGYRDFGSSIGSPVLCNLTAKYDSGPILLLSPLSKDDVRVVPGSSDSLERIPASFKCSLYWLLSDLTKGLLEDDRWDFDSDWFSSGRLD